MEAMILQIDDDEDILTVGRRMFTAAGYQYSSAKTIESGLKRALARRPSLVILDYAVGGQTGFDFLKIMASDAKYESLRSTPAIMFTGLADLADQLEIYYPLGLRAIFRKPFDHKAIVNVAENIIRAEAIMRRSSPVLSSPSMGVEAEREWLDELKMSVETIAALSGDICRESAALLSKNRVTDMRAIYNSSRRLLKMLDEKLSAA